MIYYRQTFFANKCLALTPLRNCHIVPPPTKAAVPRSLRHRIPHLYKFSLSVNLKFKCLLLCSKHSSSSYFYKECLTLDYT
jgi:hypothetical protein